MRYAKEHKQAKRQAIVEQAAARFRLDGLAAVGVRQLMTDAGLTHGGFYGHFASREALVAEALKQALTETLASLRTSVEQAAPDQCLAAFVDAYLDIRQCERPDRGCAGVSLAPEVARESAEVREAFRQGIEQIVSLLADQLPALPDGQTRQDRARTIFAMMMGSLQLARTAGGKPEATNILSNARNAALSLAEAASPGPSV
jgi:TetR/AcrR family transcriptional repressor of nem operon